MASSLITSDADLATACGRWSAAGVIGVDTEFFRERTYYPLPALVQVVDGDGVVMVDPLRISDFTPLAAVLADPSIVKLIHACGEDMEVLELLTGAAPRGVLDTQLAGAFAGHGYSLGYRSLVKELMDVVLDKGETRSDWLGRPLSATQLRNAAVPEVTMTFSTRPFFAIEIARFATPSNPCLSPQASMRPRTRCNPERMSLELRRAGSRSTCRDSGISDAAGGEDGDSQHSRHGSTRHVTSSQVQ